MDQATTPYQAMIAQTTMLASASTIQATTVSRRTTAQTTSMMASVSTVQVTTAYQAITAQTTSMTSASIVQATTN
jgi:hypothetical protein